MRSSFVCYSILDKVIGTDVFSNKVYPIINTTAYQTSAHDIVSRRECQRYKRTPPASKNLSAHPLSINAFCYCTQTPRAPLLKSPLEWNVERLAFQKIVQASTPPACTLASANTVMPAKERHHPSYIKRSAI